MDLLTGRWGPGREKLEGQGMLWPCVRGTQVWGEVGRAALEGMDVQWQC